METVDSSAQSCSCFRLLAKINNLFPRMIELPVSGGLDNSRGAEKRVELDSVRNYYSVDTGYMSNPQYMR